MIFFVLSVDWDVIIVVSIVLGKIEVVFFFVFMYFLNIDEEGLIVYISFLKVFIND